MCEAFLFFVDDDCVVAGVAGVVAVGRTYGASLFSRMTTYINGFMAITPAHKVGFITVQ